MDYESSWLGMIENPHEFLKSNFRVASSRSRYQQLEVSTTQLREFRPSMLRIEHSAHLFTPNYTEKMKSSSQSTH